MSKAPEGLYTHRGECLRGHVFVRPVSHDDMCAATSESAPVDKSRCASSGA